jgi:hypothetical protein
MHDDRDGKRPWPRLVTPEFRPDTMDTGLPAGRADKAPIRSAEETALVQRALGHARRALRLLDKADERVAIVQLQFAIDLLGQNRPANTLAEAEAALSSPENRALLRRITQRRT